MRSEYYWFQHNQGLNQLELRKLKWVNLPYVYSGM